MGKLNSSLHITYGIIFSLSLNFLWIATESARIEFSESKELESVVELPFLTSISNTEPIPFKSFTSSEVTSQAAGSDIYDQISPSRDPTTPISKRFYQHYHGKINSGSSTFPTLLNAPPPLYHVS